jgi:hypothetical protein
MKKMLVIVITVVLFALILLENTWLKNILTKHSTVTENPKAHLASPKSATLPPPTKSISPIISPAPTPLSEKKTTAKIDKIDKIANINVNKLIAAASSQGLKPKPLKAALNAYSWALDHEKLGSNKDILTVVDFTLPSYEKRMWVINLQQNKVLMKLHTTQGAGSGSLYANRFSNISNTQATSLGLYKTSEEYYGGHGKSMRLDGLQKGINNNARNRNIVIHEAAYATQEYIRRNHRAGRSWGCFAVSPFNKNKLLSYVKGGSAFFAYARAIEKNSIIKNGPIAI